MTASAVSSEHGTRRNFVAVCGSEGLISESASLGDGDSEAERDALVREEDVETCRLCGALSGEQLCGERISHTQK